MYHLIDKAERYFLNFNEDLSNDYLPSGIEAFFADEGIDAVFVDSGNDSGEPDSYGNYEDNSSWAVWKLTYVGEDFFYKVSSNGSYGGYTGRFVKQQTKVVHVASEVFRLKKALDKLKRRRAKALAKTPPEWDHKRELGVQKLSIELTHALQKLKTKMKNG